MWDFDNVTAAYGNNVITVDGRRLTFPDSYFTFFDIKRIMATQNVSMEYDIATNDVTFDKIGSTTVNVNFQKFGELIGAPVNQGTLVLDGTVEGGSERWTSTEGCGSSR